jgi:hypothetical protein
LITKIYQSQLNGKPLRCLSKKAAEKLIDYRWPGNVRELQKVLKRIIILGDRGDSIDQMLSRCQRKRDWRIYGDFAQVLIHEARKLYANDDFGLQLDETV